MGKYKILKYFLNILSSIGYHIALVWEAVNAIPVPFPACLWMGKKDLGRKH